MIVGFQSSSGGGSWLGKKEVRVGKKRNSMTHLRVRAKHLTLKVPCYQSIGYVYPVSYFFILLPSLYRFREKARWLLWSHTVSKVARDGDRGRGSPSCTTVPGKSETLGSLVLSSGSTLLSQRAGLLRMLTVAAAFFVATAWSGGKDSSLGVNTLVLNVGSMICQQCGLGELHALWAAPHL